MLACDPVGVKSVLAFGRQDSQSFERNVDYTTDLTESLRGTDVPHIVETVMWGNEVLDRFETETEYIANACRIGWELGTDILKAPYTGDCDSFEPIVQNALVRVMILGGPSSGSVQAMVDDVAGAMAAGARGIVMGRSVWQTGDPAAVMSALCRVVHNSDAPEAVWSA